MHCAGGRVVAGALCRADRGPQALRACFLFPELAH
eukprot:COSAG06_NODE_8986_length_2018_cov_1.478895_2_plen_34_part_01